MYAIKYGTLGICHGLESKLWTQSVIICIHKKGNIQKCDNYRTISLISLMSKIMI